jgi:hypothetical protein
MEMREGEKEGMRQIDLTVEESVLLIANNKLLPNKVRRGPIITGSPKHFLISSYSYVSYTKLNSS